MKKFPTDELPFYIEVTDTNMNENYEQWLAFIDPRRWMNQYSEQRILSLNNTSDVQNLWCSCSWFVLYSISM